MDTSTPPPAAPPSRGNGVLIGIIVALVAAILLTCLGGFAFLYLYRAEPDAPAEPATVAVPDLVGMTRADAEAALTSAGLKVAFEEAESSEAPAGTVVSQTIAEGEQVEAGTVVTVVVSGGESLVQVPRVVGLFIDEAERTIRDAGLESEDVWDYGPGEDALGMGEIYKQDPEGGEMAPEGSVVRIYTWGETQ